MLPRPHHRLACASLLFFVLTAVGVAQSLAFKIAATPFTLGPLNGVAFGNGTFVVSSATTASLRVFASSDGTTWTETLVRPAAATAVNSPVRFVNGKFLIHDVSVVNNVITGHLRTSPDGLTWTTVTIGNAPTQTVAEAAGDGTRILAAGSGSLLITSTNAGSTWTNVPLNPGFGGWHALAHGAGRWFLAGSFTVGFSNVRRLYTSTDGLAFTLSTAAPDVTSLAYGGGRWLLVGQSGDAAYTSADGLAFTPATYPSGTPFTATTNTVRYANGRFFSLRPAARVLQSTDGTTWTEFGATLPAGLELNAPLDLAYGNGRYVLLSAAARTSTNSLILVADASVASTAGRLINLSVLTELSAPGDAFTLGYVVGGNGTAGEKPVILRASGPSLGALGVPGTVADPRLELFAGSTPNGANDNWGGVPALVSAHAAVGAFAFTASDSLDAALATTLTTRDNSVSVSANNRGTGQVLAEIYDATPASVFTSSTPRLLNVSVRKHLGSGLTAGFVLGGTTPTRILLRVAGPGLAAFGVADTVVDPRLVLFNAASASIGENDDWAGTPALTAAVASVGAFAFPSATSKDAALLVTLAPGLYSVRASGAANTTGVALIEVYEIP